jgi:hypothetical protein
MKGEMNGALLDGEPNSLVAGSNINVAGRYLFNVRHGRVALPPAVPDPAIWAMMIGRLSVVGAAMRRRKSPVGFVCFMDEG